MARTETTATKNKTHLLHAATFAALAPNAMGHIPCSPILIAIANFLAFGTAVCLVLGVKGTGIARQDRANGFHSFFFIGLRVGTVGASAIRAC